MSDYCGSEDVLLSVYRRLQSETERVPDWHDLPIIMGDLNAKVAEKKTPTT